MTSRILLRRGTAAQWASANPILGSGELGVETDTLKFKIGNGTSTWTQLTSYANITPSDLTSAINGLINAAPSALDTLNELAAAINNDSSFSTTVNNLLSGKVSKSGGDIITAATASTTPLTIKAAASQTADLLVWQNNSGTTIGRISSNGVLINQFNYFQNVQSLGGGSGLYLDGSSTIAFNTAPSQVVFKVAGYASQTADLQQWQNSAGTVMVKIAADGSQTWYNPSNSSTIASISPYGEIFAQGNMYVRSASNYGASLNVTTPTISYIGAVIRGISGQTANLQEWQNSNGTVLSKITSDGQIINDSGGFATGVGYVGPSIRPLGYDGTSIFLPYQSVGYITVNNPGYKVIAIRGAASQTANLQEWQDSAGTVLAKVNSSGKVALGGNNTGGYSLSISNSESIALAEANNTSSISSRIGFFRGNTAGMPMYFGSSGDGANGVSALVTSSGAGSTIITSFGVNGNISTTLQSASAVGLIIKGAASQTADLQQWQDNSGNNLGTMSAYGTFTAQNRMYAGWAAFGSGFGTGASASNVVLIVKASASQTANLFESQDSNGITQTRIAANGTLYATQVLVNRFVTDYNNVTPYLDFSSNKLTVNARNASYVGLVVQGAASQTANLQEWQNSSGTALSYITKDGTLDLRNTSATAFTNSNSGNVGPKIDLWGGQYGIGIAVGRMSFFTPGSGGIALKQDSYSGTSVFDVAYNGATLIGLQSASAIGLVIKAAASQTANLQEWQNSAGTILSRIASSGKMVISSDTEASSGMLTISQAAASAIVLSTTSTANDYGLALNATGSGNNTSIGISFSAFATNGYNGVATPGGAIWFTRSGSYSLGYLSFLTRSGSGANDPLTERMRVGDTGTILISGFTSSSTGLIIKAAASQTANLQEWQDSSGSVITRIGPNGHLLTTVQLSATSALTAGTNNYLTASLSVIPLNASIIGAVIRGYTSQTADLQQWQDSSGNVLLRILSSGHLNTNAPVNVNGFPAGFTFFGVKGNDGTVPISIIRGSASQTADLQQWQNSSGTVLAKVDSTGQIISTGNDHYFSSSTAYRPNIHITNTTADSNGSYILFEKSRAGGAVVSGDVLGVLNFAGSDSSIFGGSAIVYGVAEGTFSSTSRPGRLVFATVSTNTTSMIDRMTISNSGTVTINGFGAGAQGLIVKGAASQNAYLQEWQNSSGTVLGYVRDNGYSASIAGFAYIYTTAIQGWNGVGGSISFANASPIIIAPQSASTGVLAIKGAASQTADLQQWQNSAGTVLAKVDASGNITAPSVNLTIPTSSATPAIVAKGESTYGTNIAEFRDTGNNLGTRINGYGSLITSVLAVGPNPSSFVGFSSTTASIKTNHAGATGLIIQGSASQTANLQEWQLSDGTIVAVISASGGTSFRGGYNQFPGDLRAGTYSYYNAELSVQARGASENGIVVRGAASQTADLQQWQDSSGTVLSKVDNSGVGSFYGIKSGYYNFNGVSYNGISNPLGFTTLPTIVIKGLASQTANLTEWQDSAGTVLAKVTASGGFELNGKDIELMNIMGAF